jgi:hypothetical protein
MKRTEAAKRLLDELDAELASTGQQRGITLKWTAAERQTLSALADTVDRRGQLAGMFDGCDPDDAKNRVRISTEIRQCDTLIGRLLGQISTDLPAPESRRSQKARAAAVVRWDRERERERNASC